MHYFKLEHVVQNKSQYIEVSLLLRYSCICFGGTISQLFLNSDTAPLIYLKNTSKTTIKKKHRSASFKQS